MLCSEDTLVQICVLTALSLDITNVQKGSHQ